MAGLQAMGENVAAAAAEICRVLGSPAGGSPPTVPGAYVDFLGLRMVRPMRPQRWLQTSYSCLQQQQRPAHIPMPGKPNAPAVMQVLYLDAPAPLLHSAPLLAALALPLKPYNTLMVTLAGRAGDVPGRRGAYAALRAAAGRAGAASNNPIVSTFQPCLVPR